MDIMTTVSLSHHSLDHTLDNLLDALVWVLFCQLFGHCVLEHLKHLLTTDVAVIVEVIHSKAV